MEERQFIKRTFARRLLPVALSVLLVQICFIANNLVAGNLVGNDGLAVMSVVNPVYFVFATMGALLAMGGSTLAAHSIGKNDPEAVNKAFTVALQATLGVGLALTVIGLAGLEALLNVLGTPEPLRDMTRDYLLAYIPGCTAVMGIYLPFNYLKLVGRQNQSVVLFLVMAVLNVALDLGLVLGLNRGIQGVAIATSVSFWLVFLAGLLVLCGPRGEFRLERSRGGGRALLSIIRLGSPSAVNNLCNVLRVLCLNLLLVAVLGKAGLTVFGLIATVLSFSMAISNGTALNMAPFVGVFSSEKDNESLRQLFRYALIYGLALMAVYAVLAVVFAPQVCALFSVNDAELRALAVPALQIFALSLIPALVNFLLIGFHQNNKRTLMANFLTVSRGFATVVLLAWALSRVGDGSLIWLAFPGAELFTLALGLAVSLGYSRRRRHTSPLLLIDTRAEEEGRYIAFAVPANDAAAVVASAGRIGDFCAQNGLTPKMVMTLELAIEEILVSFNENALAGITEKNAGVDAHSNVRILIHGEVVILRFRCGGKRFDPVAAAEQSEDIMSDFLGINLILGLADTVVYTHTFGVNNLTITI